MAKRYKEFTKDILLTLATIGMITIASNSPYFFLRIARNIIRNKKYIKKKFDEKKVARALERLKKNRLIILSENEGKFKIELTEEGKRKVKEIQAECMEIKKPLVWDKKWRIVIFDIPKNKKSARDALRKKLRELKFYQLQKSVWVHPYPCKTEIQFLCEIFDITPYVNIIVANEIYNDIKVKKYFKLL